MKKVLKKKTDEILQSFPGVGSITSAVLLSEMPELGVLDGSKITSLAGLAPYNRDSGRFRGQRFIGGGRAQVRSALYMACLAAIKFNPIIREAYQRFLAKGKKKKVALTACMRKIIVILNSMIRYKTMWDKHLNVCPN